MQSFLSRLLRFLFGLILAAFGLVFAASLLAAALVMLLVGLIRWAITGKKPAPVVAFNQFKQFRSRQFKPFSKQAAARPDDVVDVEMREVGPQVGPQKSAINDGKFLP